MSGPSETKERGWGALPRRPGRPTAPVPISKATQTFLDRMQRQIQALEKAAHLTYGRRP